MSGLEAMIKEKRTALELAELLRHQFAERDLRLAVFGRGNSWYAKIYAAAEVESKLQRRLDAAVAVLTAKYDLDAR